MVDRPKVSRAGKECPMEVVCCSSISAWHLNQTVAATTVSLQACCCSLLAVIQNINKCQFQVNTGVRGVLKEINARASVQEYVYGICFLLFQSLPFSRTSSGKHAELSTVSLPFIQVLHVGKCVAGFWVSRVQKRYKHVHVVHVTCK